jgi:hypothetical protein
MKAISKLLKGITGAGVSFSLIIDSFLGILYRKENIQSL